MDLSGLRTAIDGIDDRILELLNKRMSLAQQVGRLKQESGGAVYRPEREREILERLKTMNRGPLTDSAIDAIFKEIFSVSRALQQSSRP